MRTTTFCALAIATLSLGFGASASAQTWNFGSAGYSSQTGINPTSCAQEVAGCTSNTGGLNVKVSAWSTTSSDSTSKLIGATITDQNGSGIGVTSSLDISGSPNHAIDSSAQDELVLLNFGTNLIKLSAFSTGWSANDTDISLLRWDGAGGPDLSTMSLTGAADGLIAKGWTLVTAQDIDGTTGDCASNDPLCQTFGTKSSASFTSNTGSSWWIVSAYFGASGNGLSKNNDYFKLLSISGTCVSNTTGGACNTPPSETPGIPEPGTLALAGLGAIFATRRRLLKPRN